MSTAFSIPAVMMKDASPTSTKFMTNQENDAQEDDPNSCLNCQSALEGPFCNQCGQARSARLVPFKDWLGDFFGTFLKLDSKLLRTMKRILFQPGQATVDFGKGQRAPYSGPAKVYIIVSAISIAAMTLQGMFSLELAIPGLNVDAGFQKKVQLLFPFINLLSPFLTAGILTVFQRRFFFQLHLAFSLHYWSFLVAVTTPLIFIPPTSIWSLIAFLILSIVAAGYLFLAHRRVYVMPMLNRIVTCGVVLASIPIATLAFTALLFGIAALIS